MQSNITLIAEGSNVDEEGLILRRWRSRIRTEDERAYGDYIVATGLADYQSTAGNCGCQMLMRRLNDGSTEVATLSWWSSLDAIRQFAGEDIEVARYYPEDDRYLLEKPATVEHHRIVAGHVLGMTVIR